MRGVALSRLVESRVRGGCTFKVTESRVRGGCTFKVGRVQSGGLHFQG